jgi:hypothetical protein
VLFRRFIIREMRVRHSGIESDDDAQRLRCALRFGGTGRSVAARSHFALREIDDADAVSRARRLGERAPARQLDVVGVGGDRQKVNGVGH